MTREYLVQTNLSKWCFYEAVLTGKLFSVVTSASCVGKRKPGHEEIYIINNLESTFTTYIQITLVFFYIKVVYLYIIDTEQLIIKCILQRNSCTLSNL